MNAAAGAPLRFSRQWHTWPPSAGGLGMPPAVLMPVLDWNAAHPDHAFALDLADGCQVQVVNDVAMLVPADD